MYVLTVMYLGCNPVSWSSMLTLTLPLTLNVTLTLAATLTLTRMGGVSADGCRTHQDNGIGSYDAGDLVKRDMVVSLEDKA